MDCSKLTEGIVVRNYREMCELLGEDVKTGNAKILQMNNWDRYFSYKKDKHKFFVTEVYETPLVKTDGRAGRVIHRRNGKTVDLIEPLILELLCRSCNRGDLIMSKTEIYTEIGMASSEYAKNNVVFLDETQNNKDRKYAVCNYLNKKEYEINNVSVKNEQLFYFYETANAIMASMLRCALTSMKKRKIIEYENWYEIKYKNGAANTAVITEKDVIQEIQNETLSDLGISKVNLACLPENRHRYFRKRNDAARNIGDWYKIFDAMKICLLIDDDALAENPGVKTVDSYSETIDELKRRLNNMVVSRVMNTIEKDRGQTAAEQHETISTSSLNTAKLIRNEAVKDKSFLETQMFLVDNLLKI